MNIVSMNIEKEAWRYMRGGFNFLGFGGKGDRRF